MQYFVIANLDKKEYVKPSNYDLYNLATGDGAIALAYLLATNNPDGTQLIGEFYNDSEKSQIIDILSKLGLRYNVVDLGKGAGYIVPELKYFGHWAGDKIAIIGDYAEEGATNIRGLPSHNYVERNFKDITPLIQNELKWFMLNGKRMHHSEKRELAQNVENEKPKIQARRRQRIHA